MTRKSGYRLHHFGAIDRCSCGAYRYLALKTLKRFIEVVKIHQHAESGKREYVVVAKIPKSALEEHQNRNKASGEEASLRLSLSQIRTELSAVIAKMEK